MSANEFGLLVGGLLLVAALALAVHRSRDGRRRLANGLASGDPTVRLAALHQVELDGVAAHADVLLAHMPGERDEEVLAEIARLVRHSLWEPIESQAQTDLRSWLSEMTPPSSTPDLMRGTGLSELDEILGERVRRLTITSGRERLEVVRDTDEAASGGGPAR